MAQSSSNVVTINRAPVLTLWAAVVAKRLGFDWQAALSLGRAVAGLNAQSKGRRLGIYTPKDEKEKAKARAERPRAGRVELMGREVPVRKTADGLRAVRDASVVTAESCQTYLESKFGDKLEEARTAMETLAQAYEPAELGQKAYSLYTKFRPEIPEGVKGWGAKGKLDLSVLRSLAAERV